MSTYITSNAIYKEFNMKKALMNVVKQMAQPAELSQTLSCYPKTHMMKHEWTVLAGGDGSYTFCPQHGLLLTKDNLTTAVFECSTYQKQKLILSLYDGCIP